MRTRAFISLVGLAVFAVLPARAEPLPVWWAGELAAPKIEALEAAYDQPFAQGPMAMVGPNGVTWKAADCEDVADGLSRHFKPRQRADEGRVLDCDAMRIVLLAGEAESSTFRQAPGVTLSGAVVPGGAPIPLAVQSVSLLPAYLAPFDGCGFGLLALRASDRFWSLLRFAHVYGAGEKDDGRADDILNSKDDRALLAMQDDDGLQLAQNGVTARLTLLALGDFDGDGAEDALIRKDQAGASALHVVSQFRPGAVMRLRGLAARYQEIVEACPALALEFAAAEREAAE